MDTRKLSDLKTWERNYRKGDVQAIVNSIARFGFNTALRVWQGNTVIAGNHTLLALRQMKANGADVPRGVMVEGDAWVVPCVDVSHLSRPEAAAFAIADNHLTEKAENDGEQLAALLDDLKQGESALFELTGYTQTDLDTLLFDLNPSFDPVSADEQPRLDRKKAIVCPHCGEEFTPHG